VQTPQKRLIEMSRRAACVCVWSFTAHLVQTPAFAVALVAELLYETPGIKVRPPRAVLMNVTVVGELWPPFFVELRQRAGRGKLQDHPEQRVRIRRTAGKIDDRLVRQEINHAHRAGRIRVGRGNPSPGGARADGDDRRRFSCDVVEDLHGGPPGELHVNALIPGRDRALDDADVLAGVFVYGFRECCFGLLARPRHQRLVVFERDDVQNQIAQVRVGRPEQRLGAAGAVLKCQPDHRRTNHFPQSLSDVFGGLLVGDRQAERGSDH